MPVSLVPHAEKRVTGEALRRGRCKDMGTDSRLRGQGRQRPFACSPGEDSPACMSTSGFRPPELWEHKGLLYEPPG